jgi:hypothetical protein
MTTTLLTTPALNHHPCNTTTTTTAPHPAGAHGTLTQLASSCELMVVTSRQHAIQDLTLEWLDRHYAGLFSEVYFGNHFALQGASRKKSDICK